MITINELRNCAALAGEADALRERIIRLRARMEGTGVRLDSLPGGGKTADPVGTAVAELTQLQERWARTIEEYLALAKRADEAIAALPDPTHRTILCLRYVEGMTWDAMAERMCYCESWLRKLHGRAVKALADVAAQGDSA